MKKVNQPQPQPGSLAERLYESQSPIIIGVAGDSGSGKSTYTQGIEWLLGPGLVSQISLDGYHAEDRAHRRVSGRSPLDPQANHLDKAAEHLARLRRGEQVEIPTYNHASGCFDAPRLCSPTPVIMVEGLHTLYPVFSSVMDYSVYVDTVPAVKLVWKKARDTRERGYEEAEVEAELKRRATHYEQWIAGQQNDANVILRIHPSELGRLAAGVLNHQDIEPSYHLEVIVTPIDDYDQPLFLPVDLNNMTRQQALPFMLATVSSEFHGRDVNVLHVDGHMAPAALETLEREICQFIGLSAPAGSPPAAERQPAAVRFAQMLIAWPILNRIAALTR